MAVLGKVIFYASSAVALVIFPIVSARHAKHQPADRIIRVALLLVGGISVGLCITYGIFPLLMTRMLFGNSYDSIASNLFGFSIFIGIFSVGFILTMISLALSHTKAWIFTVGAALLQIAAISVFHTDIRQITTVNICVSLIMLAGIFLYHFRCLKSNHPVGN
jgi:O-antigen/teichoic acid export membrane protein